MAVYKFGTGSLFSIPSGANPTPVAFGALQDVSVDFQFTNKELYGQNIFALAIGRAQGKVAGKAKFAQVNGNLYNSLFFGSTLSTGQTQMAIAEAGTIPGTPWQVTVSHSATWTVDLGVLYTLTGLPLTRVASGPTIGQYSVAAGVYTFAAADTTLGVNISYQYTTAGVGSTITLGNALQGVAPTIQIAFQTTYNGKSAFFTLPSCIATKLAMPSKMADWNIDEFDFDAFATAGGNVATLSFSE